MYGTVSILNYALILYSTVYLRLTIGNTTVLLTVINEYQIVSNKHSFICKRKRLMMSMIDKTLEVFKGNSP